VNLRCQYTFNDYAGRYLFYIIPKRAFAREAEAAEFRELVQRRVIAK
jgi:YcxB-like protein